MLFPEYKHIPIWLLKEHNLPKNRAGGIQTTNHNTQQLEDLSTDVFGLHKNTKRVREREIQSSKMKQLKKKK